MYNRRSGFTLIELSIVLVIIGLIVGAIVVGKDLINAAAIRGTITQYSQFEAAINTFRDKYQGLPGDITQDQAAALGFQPTSRPGGSNIMHGNDILESGGFPAGNYLGSEELLFWQDLSSAQLIDGSFTSATDSIPANLTPEQIPLYSPAATIGNGTYWGATSSYGMSAYEILGITPMPLYNFFYLGRIAFVIGSMPDTIAGLSSSQAYDIDVKLDDGMPTTGTVLAGNGYWAFLAEGLMDAYGGSNLRGEGACQIETSGQWLYNTAITPADTPVCTLNIRF
jgi:prepilin-type N-terminal cleavage/methylation domain-containing protein